MDGKTLEGPLSVYVLGPTYSSSLIAIKRISLWCFGFPKSHYAFGRESVRVLLKPDVSSNCSDVKGWVTPGPGIVAAM
jgi:hypothetical protein